MVNGRNHVALSIFQVRTSELYHSFIGLTLSQRCTMPPCEALVRSLEAVLGSVPAETYQDVQIVFFANIY